MKLKFTVEGAIVFGKNLVIGDLHLGIEQEVARKGITIPSQTKVIQKKIDKLIKKYKIKQLIFIGDVRHRLPLPSRQEERELPGFFAHFKKIKISIIKGNHDGRIEDLVPKNVKIYKSSGFIIDNIYLSHGHTKPLPKAKSCSTFIIGHIHPIVEFWSSGVRMTEPVWVISQAKKISTIKKSNVSSKKKRKACEASLIKKTIVMPAFNHLIGGVAVNKPDYRVSGPILKSIDFQNAQIFLLDGTLLGKLKDLKFKKEK